MSNDNSGEPKSKVNEYSLFPTKIWHLRLPSHVREQIKKEVAPSIIQEKTSSAVFIDYESGWWVTRRDMHEQPEFEQISKIVLAASGQSFLLGVKNLKKTAVIKSLWARADGPNARPEPSRSPNSFMTGVYCLEGEPQVCKLLFDDPRPGMSLVSFDTVWPRVVENTAIQILPGDLVIFPSALGYRLPHNDTKSDRVYVFFEIVLEAVKENEKA